MDELYDISQLFSDSRLVAYYRLEGNANDSKNSNNGTVSGGVSFAVGNGKFGQGASFDGSGDYITVPDVASLRLAKFTLSAWLNPDASGGGAESWIFGKADGASNTQGYSIYMTSGLYVYGSVSTAAHSTAIVLTDSVALTSGQWTHCVITFDGTTMRLYKNGVQTASRSDWSNEDCNSSTQTAYIGSRPAWNYDYKGKMDDISVWNAALSASEVNLLYQGNPRGGYIFIQP